MTPLGNVKYFNSKVKRYIKLICIVLLASCGGDSKNSNLELSNFIKPEYSFKMAKAIINSGGSPRLTLYENVGHDSWNNAFAEKNFLKWIHSKTKKNSGF